MIQLWSDSLTEEDLEWWERVVAQLLRKTGAVFFTITDLKLHARNAQNHYPLGLNQVVVCPFIFLPSHAPQEHLKAVGIIQAQADFQRVATPGLFGSALSSIASTVYSYSPFKYFSSPMASQVEKSVAYAHLPRAQEECEKVPTSPST